METKKVINQTKPVPNIEIVNGDDRINIVPVIHLIQRWAHRSEKEHIQVEKSTAREVALAICTDLTKQIEEKDKENKALLIALENQNKKVEEQQKENKKLRELILKIPDLLHDSLGNRENEYIIKDLPENSCVDDGEFWIIHREVGSDEPLKQWIKSEIDKSLNK